MLDSIVAGGISCEEREDKVSNEEREEEELFMVL